MTLLDPITSTRRPRPGTPVLPADDVRARLLALNRPSAPFRLLASDTSGGLTVEWKIADAEWQPLFARAGIRRVFPLLLRFDPVRHVVRMINQPLDVTWAGDRPTFRPASGLFRRAARAVEFSQEIAYSEQRAENDVIHYRFETRELQEVIVDVVTGCGWIVKAPAFARL